MKKHLPSILCSMLLASSAIAQTPIGLYPGAVPATLNRTDVMSNILLNASVPNLAPATNANWDFTSVTYNPLTTNLKYAPVTGFPNATMSNLVIYNINPTQHYETNLMFAVTNAGNMLYGERLTRQAFSLNTSNVLDSLVILAQDVNYDVPQKLLVFPTTMGSNWTSSSKSTTNMTITYNPLATNAPAQRRSVMASNYKVVGWGNIKAKYPNGVISANMGVLQIESTVSSTDSFYVNGSPAPAVLLSQIGLSQGQTNYVYQRNFYRQYELTPLVSATYTDNTFSQLKDLNLNRERFKIFEDGVNEVNNNKNINIYPNPVVNKTFSVKIADAKAGSWTYEIVNMEGKKIANGALTVSGNAALVQMPAGATNGFYYVTISCNGVVEAIKPIVAL